jgi:hypothetical protein
VSHPAADHIHDELQQCIDRCSRCHDVCVTAIVYCVNERGDHAAAEHIRALLECAQACDLSRGLMLRDSELLHEACRVNVDACEYCAGLCERMHDDELMLRCAEECRRYAESCRAFARPATTPPRSRPTGQETLKERRSAP